VKKDLLLSLPNPIVLRRNAQSIAILEALMSPEWQYRYYCFNSKWALAQSMASMTDGQGDNFFALFAEAGTIVKGFDHESPMSPWARKDKSLWPGIFDGVPPQFSDFLTEPAFDIPNTTYCLWKLIGDESWQTGPVKYPEGEEDSDGATEHLSIYVGGPATYQEFALEYYERTIPLESVQRIFAHEPLDDQIVRALNPLVELQTLQQDIAEIGYPSCG
jgi:hypothetical protein